LRRSCRGCGGCDGGTLDWQWLFQRACCGVWASCLGPSLVCPLTCLFSTWRKLHVPYSTLSLISLVDCFPFFILYIEIWFFLVWSNLRECVILKERGREREVWRDEFDLRTRGRRVMRLYIVRGEWKKMKNEYWIHHMEIK